MRFSFFLQTKKNLDSGKRDKEIYSIYIYIYIEREREGKVKKER